MRLFTEKDQALIDRLQHERDAAFEAAQRFAEANIRLGDMNAHLASEIVRLAQRAVWVVPEGDVEQPKSVRDNDSVVLEDPERGIRPEPPRPARVE